MKKSQSTSKDVLTKEDFKQLATKSELKYEISRLDKKIDDLDSKLDVKFDKVMNSLDGIVGTLDDLKTDNVVGTHQIRELRVQVDNHEKRLQKLEPVSG